VSTGINLLKAEQVRWDTLCSFFAEKNRYVFTDAPTIWVSPDNETILLTTVQYWGDDSSKNHADLIAYNFTRRDTQFVIHDILPKSMGKPDVAVHKDHAAILFGSGLAYFDLIAGEKKWIKSADNSESFMYRGQYSNDEMIIVPGNLKTYAFDTKTGNLIWENDQLYGARFFAEYDGQLIGSTTNVLILDINSGEILLDEKSPNQLKYSTANYNYQGFAVDIENGFIYTSDTRFFQCIKIP